MASIRNIIETMFVTKGAEKAATSTQNVTKAQTRLGQSSASAGRQFSAQASGLGGLVAAYAGAAATIFAISSAFNALNRAAQSQQAIDGTRTLAATVGEQGDKILSKIQEITKGQLSIAEAAKTTNLALSAGFNSEQIEKLTNVALKASVALGRNLVDSQDRLIRGVAKIEPEILDELGIIVRLDDAVKKYADSIGKAASDLTTYERSQAFANATIDQGTKKFSIIDTSVTTSAEALNKFSADLQNLSDNLLGILAQAVVPFVSFLSGNFANTLAAAGVLGGLIFSKLAEVTSAGLGRATISVQNFGARLAETFSARAAQAGGQLQATLGKELDSFNLKLVRGTRETQNQVRELVKLGRQGTLTAVELRSLVKALEAQQRAGVNVKLALGAATEAYKNLGRGAQIAATATAFATKVISGATKAVNILVGAIGKIFFIVSIFQLLSSTIGKVVFGIDLFSAAGEKIKSFFEEYTRKANAANRAQAVFNKLLIETSANASSAMQNLKGFQDKAFTRDLNFVQSFFGADEQKTGAEITKTAERLATQFQEGFARQFKQRGGSRQTNDIRLLLQSAGIDTQGIDKNELRRIVQLPTEALEEREKAIRALAGDQIVTQVTRKLKDVTPEFRKALKDAVVSPISGVQAELQKETKKLYEYLENLAPGIASRFQAATTAMTNEKGVINRFQLNQDFRAGVEAGAIEAEEVDSGPQQIFTQELLNQSKTLGIFLPMLVEYQKMLQDTAYTSEGLSKSSGALRQTFEKLLKELEGMEGIDAAVLTQIKELFGEGSITREAQKAAERIAQLGDSIKKLFGKETKAAADLYKAIRVEADGTVKINKDAADVEKSRLSFLTTALGREESSNAVQQLKNKAVTALKGLYVEINREIEKQNKALDKAIEKAQLQLTIETNKLEKISLQGQIDKRNRQIAEDKDKISQATAEAQAQITNGLKVQLDYEQATLELAKQGVDAKIAAAEETLRQNNLLRDQQRIAAKIAADDARIENARKSTVASTFSNLFTDRDRQAIELEALRIDASEAIKLAEIQKQQTAEEIALAKKKYTDQLALLNTEKGIIQKRFEIEEKKLENEKAINADRIKALNAEKTSVGQNATDQIRQAELDRESRLAQINATLASQKVQKELTDKQLDVMMVQAEALDKHQKAVGDALFQHAKKVTEAMGMQFDLKRDDFGKTLNLDGLVEQVRLLKAKNQELFDTQEKIAGTQASIALQEEQNKVDAIEGARDKRVAAIDSELKILNMQKKAFGDREAIVDMQKQTELAGLEERIKAAKRQKDIEIDASNRTLKAAENEVEAKLKAIAAQEQLNEMLNDKFRKVANAAAGIVNSRLDQGLDDLFTAMKEGTLTMQNFKQGVKDLLTDILADIQKEIVKEYVLAPIKDFVSTGIRSVVDMVTGRGAKQQQQQTQNFNQLASQIKANGAQQANITGDALKAQTDLLTKTFGEVTNVQIVGQIGPLLVTTTGQGLSGLAGKAAGGVGGLGKGVSFDGTTSDTQFGFADLEDLEDGFNMSGFSGSLEDYASSVGYDMNGITDASQMVGMEFSALGTESFSLGNSFMNLGSIAQMAGAGLGALVGGAIGGPAGSAIGSIIGTIGGIFLKSMLLSSGGLVNGYGAIGRMAGGGAVHRFAGGGLQRDSVPALLEPGEFVMRKSAVESMGLPAMERMNATGKSGMPPVKIQIENSGQEKDAEQGESMMDGEAMVVKMILKDLKSNGPIRKSIRANGR